MPSIVDCSTTKRATRRRGPAMYDFLEQTVQNNMKRVRSIAPELTLSDLLRLFTVEQIHAFPVESNGQLVGIVSKADLLKAFSPKQAGGIPDRNEVMGTTVHELLSPHRVTVPIRTRL